MSAVVVVPPAVVVVPPAIVVVVFVVLIASVAISACNKQQRTMTRMFVVTTLAVRL